MNHLNRPVLICCIFCLFLSEICAQKKPDLPLLEDSLKVIASAIKKSTDDSARSLLNERFLSKLIKILEFRESFDYPFESLSTIAKIKSPDNLFRIFNWNLPSGDGMNNYFCLIQFREKNHLRVIKLTDVSDTLNDPWFRRLSSPSWYGALYYKIIRNESGGKVYYTLLGWDGVSTGMFQKLIEVMTFDDSGLPVFGAEIFRGYLTGKNKRVIFTYSSAATMILKYDRQLMPDIENKGGKRTQEKTVNNKEWMIIFDRLGTLNEYHEGSQTTYPVPAGETMDGFIFEKGGWNYIQNISVMNR